MRTSLGMTIVSTFAILLLCVPLQADPVLHKFQYWGTLGTEGKVSFLIGWTNGLLTAGKPIDPFIKCLEESSYEQEVAMVDKYYKEHPERWSSAIGPEVIKALTVVSGPCEGKTPFK